MKEIKEKFKQQELNKITDKVLSYSLFPLKSKKQLKKNKQDKKIEFKEN